MKNISFLFFLLSLNSYSQSINDIFEPGEVKFWFLGVDFSHVKLVGDFAQFTEAGKKSEETIRDKYFPGWNETVMEERDKYDVAGMLQLTEMLYDPDEITKLNAQTDTAKMPAWNNPDYNRDSIERFISTYSTEGKTGISLVFMAEALNKSAGEAVFHFVAFNRSTHEILIHERIISIPVGVGIRNYWAGAIYRTICTIRDDLFKVWKKSWKKGME